MTILVVGSILIDFKCVVVDIFKKGAKIPDVIFVTAVEAFPFFDICRRVGQR